MKNVILDTDIGSDIDDAFALDTLLYEKSVNLLAVTTVYRNSAVRAKIARALLHERGRGEIPVYCGCDEPLVQKPELIEPSFVKECYVNGKYVPPQYDEKSMGAFAADEGFAPMEIIRLSHRYAGNVEILAIGALTNLAVALRLDPTLVERVSRITVMGGCVKETIPEWNILCDPEAAQIVFESGIPLRMVGLDVCLQCKMPQDIFEKVRGGGAFYAKLIDKWKAYYGFDLPILYDPLAAVTLFTECVSFQKEKMKVCLQGELRGVTYRSAEGATIEVAQGVKTDEFFKTFVQNKKLF